jgi:lipoyl synthase
MRLPGWLKTNKDLYALRELKLQLRNSGLFTVCEEARCPNITECFCKPTATFLILGSVCTRSCSFCSVQKGVPMPFDLEEAARVAESAKNIGLAHIVITSVTRDDLPDKGSSGFLRTIQKIRDTMPEATIEILTPDFSGREDLLKSVLDEKPEVFGHNVETVNRLYRSVRPGADLERSLGLLKSAKSLYPDIVVKSGFMVGLGETEEEIADLIHSLHGSGCDCITIGQYLQPSRSQVPVRKYWEPSYFESWSDLAKSCGIRYVVAGPLVRSSYQSKEVLEKIQNHERQ